MPKMKKFTCVNCQKESEKEVKHVNYADKNGLNLFCSKECSNQFKTKRKKIKCAHCGKEILKSQKDIKKSKSGNVFCNKSCSAKFNNTKRIASKKTKAKIGRSLSTNPDNYVYDKLNNCLHCDKKLKNSQKKFCSNECFHNYNKDQYIKKWLNGEKIVKKDIEHIAKPIRNYLFEISDNKCQQCGWGESNRHTNKVPLEVHHIDGDWTNNQPDNLELLCPNCHSLTKTFRNGNAKKRMVKGRKSKRDRYRKTGRSRW